MNNLDLMRKRLEYRGGVTRNDRIVHGKYLSFLYALSNSYQSKIIRKEDSTESHLALMSPNKLKPDYNDVIVSVDFDSGIGVGDIFEMESTNTYWLIYLRHFTEEAYLRGEARECNYVLNWVDKEGHHNSTRIAARGPVETKLTTNQKGSLTINTVSRSVNFLMPMNDWIKEHFKPNYRFMLDSQIWFIEAVDTISLPNIIQINATEAPLNEFYDDKDTQIADAFKIQKNEIPNEVASGISGPSFIKSTLTYKYIVTDDIGTMGTWYTDKDTCIDIKNISTTAIELTWQELDSGEFTLYYEDTNGTIFSRVIVVSSLL